MTAAQQEQAVDRPDIDALSVEIPRRMKDAPRWLVWRQEPGPKKPRKVPYYADGTPRRGTLDSGADHARLVTFDAMLAALGTGRYTGAGFALGPDGTGNAWQGIDLDHTDTRPELAALIDQLPGYVERSPSGTGVHAIGYGRPVPSMGSNASGIEVYAAGRFFTVTGDAIGGDIEDLSGFIVGTLAPLHQPKTNGHREEKPRGFETVTPDIVADLRSALAHLRSDDRETWVRIGQALCGLGDTGRGLWLEWSQGSEKYDAADAARVWASFTGDRSGYQAVFKAAQTAGWVNPRSNVVKLRPRAKQAAEHQAPHVYGDWRDQLIVKHGTDGSARVLCRVHNLILVLANASEWKGRVRFNEFSGRIAIDGVDADDVTPVEIKAAIERKWIPEKIHTSDVLEALSVVARRSPIHPVRDYLRGLTWDGVERINSFFEDHCGCPRDDYHMAVARSLFVSAVARIFKPGCKVDTMVILQSEQGMGKTRLWLALFGQWCAEVTASLSDKDFYAGLRGIWAADFSELDAFSRAEATQIKRILTAQSDSYRPHYGRTIQVFPRQCIFVGGTNRDDWNNDPTGARRFFPIHVQGPIDIDVVTAARDQLWAEAVAMFDRGETWWDIPDAQQHQEDIYQGDPWEALLDAYLIGRESTTVTAVLGECLDIAAGKQSRADQMRAVAILKRAGWARKRTAQGWLYQKKR